MTYVYVAVFCMGMSDYCIDRESETFNNIKECRRKLGDEWPKWTKLGWTIRMMSCRKQGRSA